MTLLTAEVKIIYSALFNYISEACVWIDLYLNFGMCEYLTFGSSSPLAIPSGMQRRLQLLSLAGIQYFLF